MNYSVINQGHNEGLVVSEYGCVASFYEQDDLFNLCLYQTPIIKFNPDNDEHWEELSKGGVCVWIYTKQELQNRSLSNVNCLIMDALEWICPNQIYQEVSFNKLF